MIRYLKSIFGSKKLPIAGAADILLYLADLIVMKYGSKLVQEDVRKIIGLRDLLPKEQESVAEEIYARFENILSKDYDMEKIRSEIRVRFNLDLVRALFAGKFLSKDERDFRELENRAEALVAKLFSTTGYAKLDKFIRDNTNTNLLNGLRLTDQGILDFSAVESRLFKLPPPWLKLGVKFLREFIHNLESAFQSQLVA